MLEWFIYKKIIELGLLVSGMPKVWLDTGGYAKKSRFDLSIYIMTVLSYLYVIIMNHVIDAPAHGNNVVARLNANEKYYFKIQMELLGKLVSNGT